MNARKERLREMNTEDADYSEENSENPKGGRPRKHGGGGAHREITERTTWTAQDW